MDPRKVKALVIETISVLDYMFDEIRELKENSISRREYEKLEKQLEVLSLQVAKVTQERNRKLYYLPKKNAIPVKLEKSELDVFN
ncbi:hypothetical protein [Bacillus sp. Marseille-P3661]|uniref:hypothetical protein n=1 Tax=Bacillus sp. Marseille-P3661 TaxID=1936234 RepID=UPI000C867B25|nr:hypothetical protein [Bacillus sp. Marseille-P3661]